MILTGQKERVAQFVIERINHPEIYRFTDYEAIGLLTNGRLVGGAVYDKYTGSSIAISAAGIEGKRWLNKEFLAVAFHYPFVKLGVRRLTSFVPKKNKVARKFNEALGFKYEGNMRHAMKNDDLIIYGMLWEECKWLTILER